MSAEQVLVVEDDTALREAFCDTLRLSGFSVLEAADGSAALAVVERQHVAMIVTDIQMEPMDGYTLLQQITQRYPGIPVLVMTAFESVNGAVRAMRCGAVDYLVKPFVGEALVKRVREFLGTGNGANAKDFIAEDRQSRQLLEIAKRVAGTDATVLVSGESGTGKEVIAKYIHGASARARGRFVAVNCAAIPENLLEATMFGYEKGAFTGAHRSTPGKFEEAQGGTLLLDEISELDLGLQAKLLRVLQERQVERVGGHRTIDLDVRVIATTNRDMREEISAGNFREDLYYRLNVFPIRTVPLRNRPGDVIALSQHLLEQFSRDSAREIPSLAENARERILEYTWPGNVRELANVLQRALILQPGNVIETNDLAFELEQRDELLDVDAAAPLQEDLRAREFNLILEVLREVNGRRREAATRLGISPRTLRYKIARMRSCGIAIPG